MKIFDLAEFLKIRAEKVHDIEQLLIEVSQSIPLLSTCILNSNKEALRCEHNKKDLIPMALYLLHEMATMEPTAIIYMRDTSVASPSRVVPESNLISEIKPQNVGESLVIITRDFVRESEERITMDHYSTQPIDTNSS